MQITVKETKFRYGLARITIQTNECKLTTVITDKTDAENLAKELLAASLTLRATYEAEQAK